MPNLSEQIREYVDEVCPPVTVHDVKAVVRSRSIHHARGNCPPLHRGRTISLISSGVIVLVIVLLVEFLPVWGGTGGSEASAVLTRAAATAAAQPAGLVPKTGQYLYYQVTQDVQFSQPEPVGVRQFPFVSTQITDTWVAPNGLGRQKIQTGKETLLIPSDKSAWLAAGSPRPPLPFGVTDTVFPTRRISSGGPLVRSANGEYYLSYLDSSKFPTQPAALQKYMKHYFGITGGSTTTFLLAGDVLQIGASPALRSAIFKLIEHLPGVSYLGSTKDVAGRSGVGVAINGYANRYILVFNPNTSAVLGEKIVANKTTTHLEETVPKGTQVGFETFGTTGVTSSTSIFPDGASAPDNQNQAATNSIPSPGSVLVPVEGTG